LKFYSNLYADNGCCFHRLLQPARFLKADFPEHLFHVTTATPELDYDVYQVHGLPTTKSLENMAEWKAQGKRIVWNLDDNYLAIPKWNPYHRFTEHRASWYVAKALADVIVASTPALAAALEEPEKTVVARNLLDLSFYPKKEPVESDKVMLSWVGSQTHLEDLTECKAALDHILTKYRDKVSVVFFGYCHPDILRDWLHKGVILQEGVPLGMYHQVLSAIQPDVFLAPLADTPFNHSKSNIRVMEGWSLSSAVVASAVGEYNCIREGETGLLATGTDEWVTKLEKVIEACSYRRQLGAAGRAEVERVGDWQQFPCRGEWRNAVRVMVS
jgi:glycosyltransferase involved in cell wall biosynthesis